MIKFTYRHITRMIDLIEAEIERVQSRKEKLSVTTVAIGASMQEDPDQYYMEDKRKYDKELESLKQMAENFQKELDKLEFVFNAGEEKSLIK